VSISFSLTASPLAGEGPTAKARRRRRRRRRRHRRCRAVEGADSFAPIRVEAASTGGRPRPVAQRRPGWRRHGGGRDLQERRQRESCRQPKGQPARPGWRQGPRRPYNAARKGRAPHPGLPESSGLPRVSPQLSARRQQVVPGTGPGPLLRGLFTPSSDPDPHPSNPRHVVLEAFRYNPEGRLCLHSLAPHAPLTRTARTAGRP
jgi:hypothetical protein